MLNFKTLWLASCGFAAATLHVTSLAQAGGGGAWYIYPVLMDTIEFNDYVCHERPGRWGDDYVDDCTHEEKSSLQVKVTVGPDDQEREVEVRHSSLNDLTRLFTARGYTCTSDSGVAVCRIPRIEGLGSPRVELRSTGFLHRAVRVLATSPATR